MHALKRLCASTALLLAGLVVVAAAPASASLNTEMCKANEAKCSVENKYTPTLAAVVNSGTKIPTATKFSMSGVATFQCGSSVFEGWEYTHSEGVLKGAKSFLAFNSCTEGWTLNPEKHEGYATEIRTVGSGNGTMSILGSPTLVAESATQKCLYSPIAKALEFTITGGEPAKMSASVSLEKKAASSVGCASKATFTGTYEAFTFGHSSSTLFITE